MQKFLKYFLFVIVLWTLTLPWTAHYLTEISKTSPLTLWENRLHISLAEPQTKTRNKLSGVNGNKKTESVVNSQSYKSDEDYIRSVKFVRVGVVSCGKERIEETLTMAKSAIISSLRFKLESLELIVFADDELLFPFDTKLSKLKSEIPKSSNLKFRYEIHPLIFPPKEDQQEWLKLFRPCATQRLFLPSALPHINELLYLDTDVLILGDLREIWSYFMKMNSSQHTALAPEHESHAVGWYNRFSRHPFYPPLGVNSGVMLMNLTKMRKFHWEQKAIKYYNEYKRDLVFGDQDIINIIFHYYPEALLVFPCAFNFRPDHCIYGKGCSSAEVKESPSNSKGIRLIHGNRRVFHDDDDPAKAIPAFKILYHIFYKFKLSEEEGMIKDLFNRLKKNLNVLNLSKSHNNNFGCNELSQFIPNYFTNN